MLRTSLVDTCYAAIEKAKRLSALNMFVTDTFNLAVNKANSKTHKGGRLHGKIATIKDNICTKDVETTCGSLMLKNYRPPFDATVVERIEAAGAISIGKTNMDEFGMGSVSSSYFGTVKNPWNLLKDKKLVEDGNEFYTSGGSSGGSAATVASGVADFSIGSDTGGSVRHPAAVCGSIGFKPTYGMVSRYGLIPLNNYFDTIGIIARQIETVAEVFNVIAGPDPKDNTTINSDHKSVKLRKDFSVSSLKIGVAKEFHPHGLAKTNLEAWNRSVEVFSQKGNVKVNQVSLPHAPLAMSCYSILTSCEVASNFSRFDGLRFGYHAKTDFAEDSVNYNLDAVITKNRDQSLGKIVKGRIATGNYFLLKNNYEKYFNQSHKVRHLICEDFQRVFKGGVNILVTPTCFHETPTYSEYLKNEKVFDERDFFTSCVNIAGLPAITIPCGLSVITGMPVGVQLIGNWGCEDMLLNSANWFVKNNQAKIPFLEETL